MATRPPRYNHGSNVDTRLSRLETIIDSISSTLEKIQTKLDTESKINWAPIGIGVTIFMAVVGSFSAIYSTQMSNADANIKALTQVTQQLAVASTEQKISVQTLQDRQEQTNEKFNQQDARFDRLSDRISTLEGNPNFKKNRD